MKRVSLQSILLIVATLFSITSVKAQFSQEQRDFLVSKGIAQKANQVIVAGKDIILIGDCMEAVQGKNKELIPQAGSVTVYEKGSEGKYNSGQKIYSPNKSAYNNFGSSVAICENQLIIGSVGEDIYDAQGNKTEDAGAIYIYTKEQGAWTLSQKLVDSENVPYRILGSQLVVTNDESTLKAVGKAPDNKDYWVTYTFSKNEEGQWVAGEKNYSYLNPEGQESDF